MEIRVHRNPRPDRFRKGDFVLYRDPDLHYAGKPCTFVCKVINFNTARESWLQDVKTGQRFDRVRREYVRTLDQSEVMRDIDTAPLDEVGASANLPSAATAWLRQQGREQGPMGGGPRG